MAACPARTEVCEWPESRMQCQGEAQLGEKGGFWRFRGGCILNKDTWHIPADLL